MMRLNEPQNDSLPKLRVLIADDNRSNLLILQVFLKKLGHDTITAENGEQAVSRCRERKPDLILLDVVMPVMDGFEAASKIRAQTADRWVPIIFLSALDRDQNLVSGLEAGGDDFMSKPVNFVVLEAKMRSMQRMLLLQRQVSESLKRIEAISDSVLDAIITIDTRATIIACNASCERIFGWTPQEMIGQNVKMLMHEPYHSEHDRYLDNYVRGGPPQIMGIGREASAVRKDGRIFPMELGVSEIRFDNERLFIGILRDISERKLNEERLRASAAQLQRYHDETAAEGELARMLIERQLLRADLNDPELHYWLFPAKNFSGDVVAAARSTDGKRYALLADATGHGLTAAISTLPVLTIFYNLAPQGAPLSEIISAINHHLKQSMPVGRFVAATLVCIDAPSRTGEIWVGGTPDAFLLDSEGAAVRHFTSRHLPLGIVESDSEILSTTSFSWTTPSQLLICSDGLIESENDSQVPFSKDGLLAAVHNVAPHHRHETVRQALNAHLGERPAHDDISLLIIDCPSTASEHKV